MGKTIKQQPFKANLDIRGDNAKLVREGLDKKMAKESRKTYTNTIEAILVDYFKKHNYD